jgi:hypothetical protein
MSGRREQDFLLIATSTGLYSGCKKGRLVISRHNEIRDELSDFASKAIRPFHPLQFGMNH